MKLGDRSAIAESDQFVLLGSLPKPKRALLAAYHERGENPGSQAVLLRAVGEAGLDVERGRAVPERDEFADEVRRIRHWQALREIAAAPTAA